MKITVINFRKITKYIFIFFIAFLLIVIINKIRTKDTKKIKVKNISLIQCLEYEIPITKNFSEEKNTKSLNEKILSMQVSLFNNIITLPSNENETNDEPEQKNIEENHPTIEEPKNEEIKQEEHTENKSTEVISDKNIKATYTNKNENIEINNQTSFDITEVINNSTYSFNNNKKAIIYHTHTCESYTPTEKYNYSMTDSYRTTDLSYTVARVGDELEEQLKQKGFTVMHNKTYHDYPSYNGSYGRSLKTVQNIFQNNKDTDIIIDLHRDAVGSKSDYAPRVKIGEEICAQVMFVIGTDGSGLSHPNWRKNLQYAIEIQKIANDMYPGLFRPIILRNARYNQQITNASSIIEVGATGNTLEECLASMKYVAEVINKAVETKQN